MGNQIKTTILLALLTAVILWIGHLFGGQQGMIIALIFAGAMNFFSYWYSDKIVLKMYRAKEVTPQESQKLYEIVSSLANRANLPMPKLFIIPSETPNAFATGRNPEHAVVAVTEGLLRLMDKEEITGVIAHELAHVKNRDILIGSIAATMAGAIMLLATIARWSAIFGGMSGDDDEGGLGIIGLIVMAIIAPIAAMIIQMAISRSREYLADSTGSQIAQNPNGLANALEKLGAYSKRIPMKANPSTAHMFIVNPLTGKSLMNLFSTHPPIKERVARLRGGTTPPKNQSGKSGNGQAKNAKAFWDQLSE